MEPSELKSIRLLLGWSQSRLAQELGVHRNKIMRWEFGRVRIPKMAEILLCQWRDALGP